jgi:hypothetical protein
LCKFWLFVRKTGSLAQKREIWEIFLYSMVLWW